METALYATRYDNKTFLSPSLFFLKTPPSEETTGITTTTNDDDTAQIGRRDAMAALLSYISPFPSSSSKLCKNKSKDRKNQRLADANDPIIMLSPKIGCMGQIKTRKGSLHGSRKGKEKESPLLVRWLAPLFKGSSKVRDVPTSVKVISITEMDPPLPVKRRNLEDDLYKVSLWERRFGCRELQKLQLKQERRELKQ